jgi:hypothetical protein
VSAARVWESPSRLTCPKIEIYFSAMVEDTMFILGPLTTIVSDDFLWRLGRDGGNLVLITSNCTSVSCIASWFYVTTLKTGFHWTLIIINCPWTLFYFILISCNHPWMGFSCTLALCSRPWAGICWSFCHCNNILVVFYLKALYLLNLLVWSNIIYVVNEYFCIIC